MKSVLLRIALGIVVASLIVMGFNVQGVNAGSGDRFRPSSPTVSGEPDDALSTPQDFENAAASHPYVDNLMFVSRCRFAPFTGNLNFYTDFTGNTADAITGDKLLNYNAGTKCYSPQNETIIVLNPKNPNNMLTAGNEGGRIDGHMVYSSQDGGRTWTNVILSGWTGATGGQGVFSRLRTCGDPSLAFGPDGTAYFGGLVCNENLVAFYSGVAVSSSHDGGLTWSPPVMVSYSDSPAIFNDKEFMTVGLDGTVYIAWARFMVVNNTYVQSPIALSKSTDGGSSWTDWVAVNDRYHPYNQGAFPLIAPDGSLYVAFEGATSTSNYNADAVILAHSKDGGKSFTNQQLARVYDDYNCYPINILQNRQTLSGEQFRVNSLPSFAIDPMTGKMAIVWADDQANAGCGYEKGGSFAGQTSNQVKIITSSDGMNWSAPRVITSGGDDKVFPAVGANAGRIAVSYYTRAYSPATDDCRALLLDTTTNQFTLLGGPACMDYVMKSSSDDFSSETRLTDQSSNPYIQNTGVFIGDYTGAAVDANGKAYAAWADFRGNPGITTPNMDIDVAFGR